MNKIAEVTDLVQEVPDDLLQDMSGDQLSEYKDMLKQLGAYPDKVIINTLSMIAEDYSLSFPKSCTSIYFAIREFLLSTEVKPDCKLPLVYVIDSILKNVKGLYIEIMKDDIQKWMMGLYQLLEGDELARMKLRRVWKTWNEFKIFPGEEWSSMGKCFTDEDDKIAAAKTIADAKTKAAGIDRMPDGSLLLSSSLRKQMQAVLDDVQADETNELKKVSLERLADINPDLLVEIKRAAEGIIKQERSLGIGDDSRPIPLDGIDDLVPQLFTEIRSPQDIERCNEWEKLDLNYLQSSNESIKKLLYVVRTGTATMTQTTNRCANATKLLGSTSAAASTLSLMMNRLKTQDKNKGFVPFTAGPINNNLPGALPTFYRNTMISTQAIDPAKFTNEGLKEKNESVIARLYDGGLPFICSADGRRFSTQREHSRHLDELFRKNQLEKAMERTDERDWYTPENMWCRRAVSDDEGDQMDTFANDDVVKADDNVDPRTCVVFADESRDTCVICGSKFEMDFDQDEGEFKYRNCREIEVLNDDVAEKESESMLVHVTCLRGLGSPELLTIDQVLQL
jgi:pre-mRNA cleavage complex 2 protein Pcf11